MRANEQLTFGNSRVLINNATSKFKYYQLPKNLFGSLQVAKGRKENIRYTIVSVKMQLSTLSNPYSPRPNSNNITRKLIKEEIELRERPESQISRLWKIITISGYFVIVTSGIVTSISIGTLRAAFHDECVLYARLTLVGLDEIAASGNRTLYFENIRDEKYGPSTDCTFCQYCSAASVIFAGIWGVMFLQCGRGGVTPKNKNQSWTIVPLALVNDIVFFLLSIIIFAKTIGGLNYFCTHIRVETRSGEPSNFTECRDILRFHFPDDIYNTDLYLNYVSAQMGSLFTFLGWMVVMFVLILRCFIPIDFVVYGRKLYEVRSVNSDTRDKRKQFADRKSKAFDAEVSASTSFEVIPETGSPIATTSFTIDKKSSEKSKKLS